MGKFALRGQPAGTICAEGATGRSSKKALHYRAVSGIKQTEHCEMQVRLGQAG